MEINEQAIQRVIGFSRLCVQNKHPWHGKPLELLAWQTEFIRNVYGQWLAGERLINRASLWVPKKNGKSTLLSMLCLYHLVEYPGSEVYCVASDVKQAGIIYDESCAMICNGALNAGNRFRIFKGNDRKIEDRKGKSLFRVLSSDKHGAAGYNANFLAFDELASWGASARDVYSQLQNATAARINSLQIVLSTAQFVAEHIGKEQYDYAKRVKADPILDDRYYPCIYECPNETGKEWQHEKQWQACNPSCGITFPLRNLRDDYKTVVNNPKEEFRFRTLRLNQWMVGGMNRWLSQHAWLQGKQAFNENELYGLPAYIGVDFARRHDLCCYVIAVPKNGLLYLLPRSFIPEKLVEDKERTDKFPYRHYASKPENNLYLTTGDCVDTQFLRDKLLEDCRKFFVKEIGMDPHGSESERQQLQFIHGYNVIAVPQTKMFMSSAFAFMEREVIDNRLRHDNPILDWCISNAQAKPVGDDQIMLTKAEDTQRIDLAVASAIALSRYLADPERHYTGNLVLVI